MGFRFPLASVLGFRQSVERREELALEQVHQEIVQVQQATDALTAHIENVHQAREDAMQQAVPASHLQSLLSEAEEAREKKDVLLKAMQTLEQRRNQQSDLYQSAHRARRMLSDMSDRQKDVWERNLGRTQQKFLDDLYSSRSQR